MDTLRRSDIVSRSPAFQFYADDFYAGVAGMSDEEVGVYIKLLCLQWSKGHIDEKIAMAASRNDETISTVLSSKFYEKDGLWSNSRLEEVREIQQKRSKAGSKGGSKTQAKGQANHQANGQAESKPPSPSPSPPSEVDIDIDDDHTNSIFERERTIIKRMPTPPTSRGDRLLAWQAAYLTDVYSENWLFDSIEGVRQTGPKKPWAYLTTTLRTAAAKLDRDFDSDRKKVPRRPAQREAVKVPKAKLKQA